MVQSSFEKINFLLALSGHQLLPKYAWQRVLRYVLMACCLVRASATLYIESMDIIDSGQFTSYATSVLSFYSFSIWFHLVMIWKRGKIALFIQDNLNQVHEAGWKRLRKSAVRNVTFFWISCISLNLLHVCEKEPCAWKVQRVFITVEMQNGTNSSIQITPIEVAATYASFFYETVTVISWLSLSLVLYNYSHTIKDLAIGSKLGEMIECIGKHHRTACRSRKHEFQIIRSITMIHESFNQTFAVFPFLAFGLNIIQTAGFLFSSLNGNYEFSVTERILLAVVSIQFLLVPIAMSMTAGFSDETEALAKKAIQMLEKDSMSQCDIRLVLLINRITKLEDRGIMFSLSRHTIPVFAGHTLSFAIIFMQLFNTGNKNNNGTQ